MGEAPSGLQKIVLLSKTHIDLKIIQHEDERDRSDYFPHQHFQSGVIRTLLTRDQLRRRSESPRHTLKPTGELGGILHDIRQQLLEAEPERNDRPSPNKGHLTKTDWTHHR